MTHTTMHVARGLTSALLAGLMLAACGGGSDFTSPAFTLGGTVSGLDNATSVELTSGDASNSVTVSADGAFEFPTALSLGSSYAVTVATQPTNQTCTVTNGTGSSITAAVSDVAVSCVTNGYAISGTVSGLDASTSVTLSNNGTETVVVSADGSFSFTTPVQAYAVTVTQQPTGGKYCSVSNGTGTASADVSNVSVSCSTEIQLECGANQALTGIQGRKGGIIDQLQVRCADIVSSAVDTNTTAAGASAGGSGGSAFGPFTCPAGEWISAVSGYNGSGGYPTAMASVQVTCSGGSQSSSYNSFGTTAFSFSCPVGKRSTGFIIGAVGGYTGFMQGMLCEP